MNAARLLALYERISEAPDAVTRLRRFVLDLAVRGKLVPQDLREEPSQDLLRRIGRSANEISELPSNWRRARVGVLVEFQYGKGLPAGERSAVGPVPVFGSNGIVGYTKQALTNQSAVIVGRKGSAGALNICDGPSWTTDVAYFVEAPPYLALRFLLLSLDALQLGDQGKGVKPGLSRSDAYRQEINVPPLAEQHRIVAKVDELMGLCDRLEAARTARESARDRLATSSLARLNTPDPETFPADARFALNTLPALTTRPDQIKPLRQTILNLAVRGKLVPQDPNDEPASELLKRIAREKAGIARSRGGRGQSGPSRVGAAAAPAEVPRGWQLARLGDLIHLVSGQHLQPHEYCEATTAGLPYITGPSDFSSSGLLITRSALVRKAVATRGQLLLTVKGSGVGKMTVCELPEVAISRQLMALTAIGWDARFLEIVVNRLGDHLQERARSLIPGISREDVEGYRFPLPPLAEQHRIVAKVNELMALCDALEASLAAATTARTRLLEAALAEALAPTAAVAKAAE